VIVLGGALVGSAGAQATDVRGGHAAATCHVSDTSHPVPGRPSFNFGSARLAVALPRGARFVAVREGKPGGAFIQSDGWIRTKVGWFSARTAPTVTGRRIDGTGRRLRADVGPLSYAPGSGSFYPSLLYFPSFGCWRLAATAGRDRLDATVIVIRSTR
jgi:hypothetical protein